MDSIVDYLSYIGLKTIGPLLRSLPVGCVLFLGRTLGVSLYYFDFKHKAIAYANIKKALGGKFSLQELSRITKKFYVNLGQNLIEIFLIPKIDRRYMNEHLKVEGRGYIDKAFKKGKGVILLAVHAGSWELSNVVCSNLGFPINLLVRGQKMPRLNKLLNYYRRQKGCKLIQRENQTRALIDALKNNEAVGMTIDQGGKTGALVKFLGRSASMATGAIKIALKHDCVILPAYYTRINGPYHKLIIEPEFELKKTQNPESDIRENLQRLVEVYEKNIRLYPEEYLWTYKIWKYAKDRNVLILSDGKTGHLRQAQALAKILTGYLMENNVAVNINTVEVKISNKFALTYSSILSGRYNCQGCLCCLKRFLSENTYKSLIGSSPDIVVSCGSSIAPVNYIISRENQAKAIVILKPSFFSMRRFDLVIMPKHDNPPKRKNVCATQGALNLIDEKYLKEQSEELIRACYNNLNPSDFYLGLLIGGNTKEFTLRASCVREVTKQIKLAAEKIGANILVSTSRRTPADVEGLIKEEFKGYSRCKLLVIANEKNLSSAMGGILGLSSMVISSPESISMISEAVNSRKYVLVFSQEGLGRKHQNFVDSLAGNKYIYLVRPSSLQANIENIWHDKPLAAGLGDNNLVREAISKII